MLRCLFLCGFLFFVYSAKTQAHNWRIDSVHLPEELRYFDNQYSCLNIYKKKLYLMPECRLLEGQEAKLYSFKLSEMEKYMADTSYLFGYQKHPFIGLDVLINKMLREGQVCEGLEAMVIHKNDVYLTVETTTASTWCFLLKGKLKDGNVYMDTSMLLHLWKPRKPNGDIVFNASYECMEWYKNRLFIFFEYNYFPGDNYVYSYNKNLEEDSKDSMKIERMAFRISDIKGIGNDHFVAINSFYKGGGKDTINRPATNDTLNNQLVMQGEEYHDYTRLVDIHFDGHSFTWKPLFEMPRKYEGFNWEGIVPYKGGYFLVTDKYAPTKPYYSKLIYIKPSPGSQ